MYKRMRNILVPRGLPNDSTLRKGCSACCCYLTVDCRCNLAHKLLSLQPSFNTFKERSQDVTKLRVVPNRVSQSKTSIANLAG